MSPAPKTIISAVSAALLGLGLLAPAAQANDIFDGGRITAGSTQLLPTGSSANPLPEVDTPVDLERYAGTWYQVAAVPQPFTLQCVRDTRAEYALVDAETISVRNTCGTFLGSDSAIEGTATVRGDASLRVNFPGVPFQDPNGPVNYRITYLAQDYSLAVVGDPDRRSGFVLSRTPQLSAQQWSTVASVVQERGWWPCAFVTQPTSGGREDVRPLCAL